MPGTRFGRDTSTGLKIDGQKLEPRHILGASVAIGLVTSVGLVDVLLEPKGFEGGFQALTGSAVAVDVDGTKIRVGALADLITSKELLAREKDRVHLQLLKVRQAELRGDQGPDPGTARRWPGRDIDSGFDVGL